MLTGFAGSVAAESARQLDVEGVEVDVAHALEELGGPGFRSDSGRPSRQASYSAHGEVCFSA